MPLYDNMIEPNAQTDPAVVPNPHSSEDMEAFDVALGIDSPDLKVALVPRKEGDPVETPATAVDFQGKASDQVKDAVSKSAEGEQLQAEWGFTTHGGLLWGTGGFTAAVYWLKFVVWKGRFFTEEKDGWLLYLAEVAAHGYFDVELYDDEGPVHFVRDQFVDLGVFFVLWKTERVQYPLELPDEMAASLGLGGAGPALARRSGRTAVIGQVGSGGWFPAAASPPVHPSATLLSASAPRMGPGMVPVLNSHLAEAARMVLRAESDYSPQPGSIAPTAPHLLSPREAWGLRVWSPREAWGLRARPVTRF